ncbi:DUF2851 family protein [Amniculibacterium aquaticum]|uniref:DUF2851 family protein n=1 Tax=Amniculibacterium aquaticum TaxID=2479858 RepID=UPI000F5B4A2B|nr:DUF2851 family protein [Amniculibacterium aquaticum]
MTEKLLQYLWNYKIFNRIDFKDTLGRDLEIIQFGTWNTNAGPDFLLGKIKIENIDIAGSIELHLKSSDWLAHQHSQDKAYDNTILHVVYFHDVEIDDLVKKNVPTLELKSYIDRAILMKYETLSEVHDFIPCQSIFEPEKVPFQFSEEGVLQKLDEKSIAIEQRLSRFKNNFEAVLFHSLAYAFGLKINAEIFQQLAESLDFTVVQKIRQNREQLEALFYGTAGWLDDPKDHQSKRWIQEFQFLKSKFNLNNNLFQPRFLRLRPPNFPTLRLSQLAGLYHQEVHLFSKIMNAKKLDDLYAVFSNIKASEYWDNHFNFGKISTQVSEKSLSRDFIHLLIVNAVLPMIYAYKKNQNEDVVDDLMKMYAEIPAEDNHLIRRWKELGLNMHSALDSQAYLFHYKNYCLEKKCLNCSIAFQLLKS